LITQGILVSGSVPGTNTAADIIGSTLEAGLFDVQGWSTIATGVVKVSVRDSLVGGNSIAGMLAESSAGASVTFSASNNVVSNNGTGMLANSAGAKT
jgi:hypothetical protein